MNNEAFEAYAEEFASVMEQVTRSTVVQDDQHWQLLQQCQELLQQMAVEARNIEDAPIKRQCLDRHKVCKSQWQTAKWQAEQTALLHSKNHAKVPDAADSLARQNFVLAQAARSIQETEDVASGITANLAEHRETLERTRTNVKEVRSMTSTANQIATNLLKPWWRKGL